MDSLDYTDTARYNARVGENEETIENLEVGCAVIINEDGKILIAQRKPGVHLGGFWEFPGGKREDGEGIEACLIREVYEELGVEILPRLFLFRRRHTYPAKEVLLDFYLCDYVCGRPYRRDCLDFRWVAPDDLRRFRFLPADTDVLNDLLRTRPWGRNYLLPPVIVLTFCP